MRGTFEDAYAALRDALDEHGRAWAERERAPDGDARDAAEASLGAATARLLRALAALRDALRARYP
jgi:hypothetical protein